MTLVTNHLPTAELQALDAAHHMHPFTTGDELNAKGARVITRAKGVYLTDSEGNEILDAMAGLWCVNLGYGRPEMGQVAARQMNELPYYNTFFQTTHVPAIALSAELAKLTPAHLNHVFYAGSGSEANDTNLRMVRVYWAEKGQPQKSHVISRKNAYHGSSIGSGSLGGMTYMHAQGGMPIPGIHHIGQPDWWAEGGDHTPEEFGLARAQELEEKILELGAENVAAFIGEPVQGAGGVIVPPSTYWPEIQRICKKYDVLLIADEVICGFGRTGNWFGCETMGITPDIITIAKGLSSGYAPIGGSIVSDEIAEVINACEFNHGYTYSGHPVCAAVAMENLRIMQEEDILSHVHNVAAPALHAALETLGEHPLVGTVNKSGMMASLPLTPHKESRAKFAGEGGAVGYMCREHCFANSLVMRHVGDRMIISPPLVITPEEIEVFTKRATQALDATYKDLKDKDMLKAAS
ncbi:putative aminotransferase [Sulfitobacter noctilucicola]|uniref:Putrescine aminotransferase n=1 Tax=Sulfitobacter noctilucicola TaxID=1342301 RepID=A0A7W6M4U6_9RHOB|nr:aspartate aminotransferase family protein [Sulfitobacter noctilucicola]KIN62999.1 putative aminotransferase [Sulfitobacter noctilucicola]MBB4172474.1 putrescine aminotransferase [Sulfitobacter noctilucicola]